MRIVIKFLTDCYQFMIVVGFVGSMGIYLMWAFVNLIAIIKYHDSDLGGLLGLGVLLSSLVIVTVLEAVFLLALGGAAILIDIRNELAWINAKDQE